MVAEYLGGAKYFSEAKWRSGKMAKSFQQKTKDNRLIQLGEVKIVLGVKRFVVAEYLGGAKWRNGKMAKSFQQKTKDNRLIID